MSESGPIVPSLPETNLAEPNLPEPADNQPDQADNQPDRADNQPDRADNQPDRTDGELPTGPRRILVALYAVFALAATARAVVQLATQFHAAPLAYLLSLFSGVVYLCATLGLVTDRRWSRPLAWGACGTELCGVIAVGVASLIDSTAFPHDSVWSHFGSGYGYFPMLLPVLGLLWLRYSGQELRQAALDLPSDHSGPG